MRLLATESIRVGEPVASLFPIDASVLGRIVTSMRAGGYDDAEPLVLGTGTWPGAPLLVDGHTRLRAARSVGLARVPVVERRFPNIYEALRYAIARSQSRHNRTDGAILRAVGVLDRLRPRGRKKGGEKSGDGPLFSRSEDETAAAIGTSGDKVRRARRVQRHADLAADVQAGKRTIASAEREAAKRERAAPRQPPVPRIAYDLRTWQRLDEPTRAQLVADGRARGRTTFNAQRGSEIDWAKWSWNPVSGCLHACPYCYARDIAADLHQRGLYPFNFAPAFYPQLLAAPTRTAVPEAARRDPTHRNVFVCSMADLFGRWVPADWIAAVLETIRAAPQWRFLLLTKFPKRYADFSIPDNAWIGTTVDCQARVAAAEEAFARVDAAVKWLSVEPMLEPLRFAHLERFQWIVLGGASASTKTPEWRVPAEWWSRLHAEAVATGLAVYHKTNLYERLAELPDGGRRGTSAAPRVFAYLGKKDARRSSKASRHE